MGNAHINLQDSFLNQAKQENLPVIVSLINGSRLEGKVKGFDNFTLALSNNGRDFLVYKHAISTITPIRSGAGLSHHHHNRDSSAGKKELTELADKFNKR